MSKIYKLICIAIILIMLTGCSLIFSKGVEIVRTSSTPNPIEQMEQTDNSHLSFNVYVMLDRFHDYLENPWIGIKSGCEAADTLEVTQLKRNDGYYMVSEGMLPSEVNISKNPHYYQAIRFLYDDEAIRQCFGKANITNIQNISKCAMGEDGVGFIIEAKTENEAYYMTVPFLTEQYGPYIYQHIYTLEEMREVYAPKKATLYVDGVLRPTQKDILLGDTYIRADLFDLLTTLNILYDYDKVNQLVHLPNNIVIDFSYERTATIVINGFKGFLGGFSKDENVYYLYYESFSNLMWSLGYRYHYNIADHIIFLTTKAE